IELHIENTRNENHDEQEESSKLPLEIQDHYSVTIPSSSLRLRTTTTSSTASSSLYVYEHKSKQVLLEQIDDNDKMTVTVKHVTNTSVFSVYALRAPDHLSLRSLWNPARRWN
ncbi:MAG: hypothetical protein AAF512_13420, partial [Pseudomonadota bacterium]